MLFSFRMSIVLGLAAGSCVLQGFVASQQQDSSTHTTVYKRAAHEIAKSNPAISNATLDQDLHLVDNVESKVRAYYPKTFSDEDVQRITVQTWIDLRQAKPEGPLDLDRFERYALESFGGLRITSQPEGAAIEVDQRPWADSTDAQSSCRTGNRHIKLSKDGYEDEVGDAVVKEGQWTLFNRTLKKRK
jgi:hypothetical protein